jgi:hypothetical protein
MAKRAKHSMRAMLATIISVAPIIRTGASPAIGDSVRHPVIAYGIQPATVPGAAIKNRNDPRMGPAGVAGCPTRRAARISQIDASMSSGEVYCPGRNCPR